jgi:hypothetical protein
VPAPAPGRNPIREAFNLYSKYFTDTAAWDACMNVQGRRVIWHMQARHDHFVSYEEGAQLFQSLVKHNGLSISSEASSDAEELVDMATEDGKSTDGDDIVNKSSDSESGGHAGFQTLVGGHVTGFVLARRMLAPAVLQALSRLSSGDA